MDQESHGSSIKDSIVFKDVLSTVVLAVSFFVIAFVMKWAVTGIAMYGLHAAVCAPFFALLVAQFIFRTHRWIPAVAGMALVAIVLGIMRPVQMGIPVAVLALALCVGCLLTRGSIRKQTIAGASVVSVFYPVTVLAGIASGSYAFASAGQVVSFVVVALLVAALCVILGIWPTTRESKHQK
jgi:hypothetical protein